MKCTLGLLVILSLLLVTFALVIPAEDLHHPKPSHHELNKTPSVDSSDRMQIHAIRKPPPGGKRAELGREGGRRGGRVGGLEKRARPRRTTTPELELEDLDLTPEELDAFLQEEDGIDSPAKPTLEEVQAFLTPEERAEFQAARMDLALYNSAYKAIRNAKTQQRTPTAEEEENIRYANQRKTVYATLRTRGLNRLIITGTARPEVMAYWQAARERQRKWWTDYWDRMTDDQREAFRVRKAAIARAKRAAIRAKMEELEARVRDNLATKQDVEELANLGAWRDHENAMGRRKYANLSLTQRVALQAKKNARNKKARWDAKAARRELETRVKDRTASVEDVAEWDRIQEEEQQTKVEKETKKALLKVLEKKIKNKTANQEEKKAWLEVEAVREKRRKMDQKRKEKELAQAKTSFGQDEHRETNTAEQPNSSIPIDNPHPASGVTDPLNGQPLPFSSPSQSSAGVRMPLKPKIRLHGWQKPPLAIQKSAGARLAQVAKAFESLWQTMTTGGRRHGRYSKVPAEAVLRPAGHFGEYEP
ncbi:MAG: hypothetical protein M1826_005596 [Phylliscum demangeonii]|nr:MAG: hypothetical protein M1826_005596 [Phylliscum demangeonii]